MAQESFDQLHNAVKQAESRGQRYDKSGELLTSPKGAQGEMQVMPATQLDPGYGVAPAKDRTPAEIARVGKDYLSAMLNKYGNEQHALVAYNWGPANADNWLASGANPAKLPAETQNYLQKVQEYKGQPLSASGAAPAAPSVPKKVAGVDLNEVGPGYKAAMAMMFLADDKPKSDKSEDDDIWKESEPEVAVEEEAPSPLAGLELGYQSPFPVKKPAAPQRLAAGGLAGAPKVGVKGTAREALDAVKAEYDQYAKDADTYNTELNQYKTDIYDPYAADVTKYNTGLETYKTNTYNPYVEQVTAYNNSLDKYKQDLYNPYLTKVQDYNDALAKYKTETYDPYITAVDNYNAALNKYNTDVYTPYSTALDLYNKDAETWNAGPRTTAFDKVAPTLSSTFDLTAPTAPAAFSGTVPTAPEEFSGTAPAAPEAFAMTVPTLSKTFDKTAPTTPKTTQADYDAMVAAARQDATNRQQALDVAGNPEAYGLTINKLFARGGVVHRADGSPETGELTPEEIEAASRPAFVTPKSGIGRVAGPISKALNTGEAYPAMARGVAELPYDVVGGPVDIATLAMRPFGYKDEKPVMGSEWIKEKMTKYGIRPGEEANPTLQGFRTAGELGASAVNPGPVAAKVGQAAEKGAAFVGKEAARQMLRGMEGEGALASISPPIMYAREPGKAAAGPIFSHTPSNEAPFVGRLDEYIANLPGPVQKQQFFGQLKGKFRDYEIGRAEEALKELPDNAKLTPSDLLNRVKGVYDPGRYKTTVMPPDESSLNNRWRSMDNPFYDKATDEGVHLGVIHLNKDVPPEVAQRQMVANEAASAVKLMNSDWFIGRYPEKIDQLDNFLKTSGVQLDPELAKKIQTGSSQYRKISQYEEEMKAAKDKLLYPTLDPRYDELHDMYEAKMRETDPNIYKYAARSKNDALVVRDLANEANAWLQKNGYEPVALPDFQTISTPSAHGLLDQEYSNAVKGAFAPAKETVDRADNNLSKYMKGTEEEFKKAIGHELPYMGQHESLGGGPAQIAFSRYSEHTADIPGMGPTKGIYVHELQSDMLDDLRKLGPKRGSAKKDSEEYNDIVEKLKSLEKARGEAYAAGNNKMVDELDNQLVSAGGRADVLSKRLNGYKTNYSMDEAFHKMESGGKTAQQLMAKNAIAGAIQQGKNFVAFPGVESAQAKLYEKLPRNLKDVIKDLGPGFEIRPVELSGPAGKSMHTAVVWGPEAAARIQKKGVPFAKGGSVDKVNADNRRYL